MSSRPLTSTKRTTERLSNRKTFTSLWFSYEFYTTFLYALGNLCLPGERQVEMKSDNHTSVSMTLVTSPVDQLAVRASAVPSRWENNN
jgi:hypothetical protein